MCILSENLNNGITSSQLRWEKNTNKGNVFRVVGWIQADLESQWASCKFWNEVGISGGSWWGRSWQ